MTDQSYAASKGVELGPLEPICAKSERAKLTADKLEGLICMPTQVVDVTQASVSCVARNALLAICAVC